VTVQVWCHARDASAWYRLLEPARLLGVDVVDDPDMVTADTVVTNRPVLPEVADQVVVWRREGRRVVVDMDDAFDWLPVGHGIEGTDVEPIHRACRAADVVTCSTPALVGLYGYGKGHVVRNGAPRITARATTHTGRPWVGWVGSVAAHPHDLDVCGHGVAQAAAKAGAVFAFVGPKPDTPRVKAALEWPDTTGFIPLGPVPLQTLPAVLTEYTAGIAPLALDRFNTAKSWLKGIEYAAAGVPAVASPTPEYQLLAGLGGCVLASTPDEWFTELHRLLTDPAYHADRVATGVAVAELWSYEVRAEEWCEVWQP
jgi:hypothetical protein